METKSIIEDIRKKFPALAQQMNGQPLIYLDNAATSQKPVEVLELLDKMNAKVNANVHRAMYQLSDEATGLYEGARERVRQFINAPDRENIIYTSGTTASINLVATSFCQKYLMKGDVIVITADSHHSNIVPWQLAAERIGAEIRILPIDGRGALRIDQLDKMLDDKVRIVAATHISNVLGIVNPIEKIIQIAHSHNIPVLIDGAQGIVHAHVDVQKMDCDFYAFSAHKIYGATGVGILYGKSHYLNEMPPYMGGGDMVGTVTYQKTSYAPLPLKFEAGTPNFIGASTLKPALDFAASVREGEVGEAVKASEQEIIKYMLNALPNEVGDVEVYGLPEGKVSSQASDDTGDKIPLFSFNIKGCNAGDVAQLLDKMGVAVRTGLMCAEPLLNSLGVTSVIRASFAPYNTLEEAEKFIECVKRAKKMLM